MEDLRTSAAGDFADDDENKEDDGENLTAEEIRSNPVQAGWKPMLFASAPDDVDDLKQIKGVGETLQQKLNQLGVYQFQQIADWTDDHVAWMDDFLSFSGRIDREEWRQQAKVLADGGSTEFSQRVEKGDVDY